MIQLLIKDFPKQKQKFIFESIELIKVLFKIEDFKIDIEEADMLIKNNLVYHNEFVEIRRVTKTDEKKICVSAGNNKNDMPTIKWVYL